MVFYNNFLTAFSSGLTKLIEILTIEQASLINVFIFAVIIAIYSIFTWKFYTSLSKKDLIDLNLRQYNRTTHPVLNKSFEVILYFVEYLIILPFLIFFWFAILSLLILLLSEELRASQVIVISAAMVAALRMLAYYNEELSRELAKVFPFTVLAIFAVTPSFFSLERIILNLNEIPAFLGKILLFLVFIISVELILRIIDLVLGLFGSKEEVKEKEVVEEKNESEI